MDGSGELGTWQIHSGQRCGKFIKTSASSLRADLSNGQTTIYLTVFLATTRSSSRHYAGTL